MPAVRKYRLENKKIAIEVSSIGAELKSLMSDKKVEYIWSGDPKYWNFSAPFLFPIVGSLKDKKMIIEEKEYFLKQHGLLRHQDFSLMKQTKYCLVFQNEASEETLEVYPFKYQAVVKYTIKDKSVTTQIKIVNIDNKPIAFNLGGHPGFNCPLLPGEKFSDYSLYFTEPETFSSPRVAPDATLDFTTDAMKCKNLQVLPLNKQDFNIDTIIIPRVKSQAVLLLNAQGQGLNFSYNNFKTLAIWTPVNDAPFICLEPWIGYNDRFDTDNDFLKKDDLIILEVGEEFSVSYQIELID
ncbi:MAG TPA: aldose 1-epimerase family protein [Bacilli bacterium]|nr:aldose 1-epimerase family protein [Bacilli bacterium]